jgi:arginine deiminase
MNIKYFTYYYDIIHDITFIERSILEQCRRYDIEIDSIPRIINGKNCYSIDEDKLKEFIEKSKYVGNRVLILTDTKEIIRKTKELVLCKYNNELYIPQEVVEIYKSISNNKLIRVDGKFYTRINEDELNSIRRAYRRKGIDLKNSEQEIYPVKK